MRRTLLWAWWLIPATALAQTPTDSLSITSLIQEALEHNPRLSAQRSLATAAEARIGSMNAWESPTIVVSWMGVPTSSLNPFSASMERRFQAEQMVPFPGKVGAAVDAASAGSRMAIARTASAERTLAAEVKRMYVQVSAAQNRLHLNTEQQRTLAQLSTAVETKYSVGRAQQADVIRLSIESRKLQNERSELERELRSAGNMLNLLLGRPVDRPWPPLPPLPMIFPSISLQEMNLAGQQRPDVRMAEAGLSMAQADLTMAKREYWPDLALGGAFTDRTMLPDSWDLMVGIRIPIAPWSIGAASGRVAERTAGVSAAERDRDDMIRMTLFEVSDQWHRMNTLWEQARRYRHEILPEARQALEALRGAYQTNSADFLSLVDSFRMLQMYEMELIMKEMDFQMSRAMLEEAVGMDLP